MAAAPETTIVTTPAPFPLGDAVVLVIDDDAPVLEAMEAALQSWGVRAVTARSLQCALARLPECGRYPDAIISDFRLGAERTGIEAIQRIQHELGVTAPAMIITGDTAPKSLRVIQASGYSYLPKPVTAERLRTELAVLLEKKSAPPANAAEP
jgi:DNA-binding NtrC family response regulator